MHVELILFGPEQLSSRVLFVIIDLIGCNVMLCSCFFAFSPFQLVYYLYVCYYSSQIYRQNRRMYIFTCRVRMVQKMDVLVDQSTQTARRRREIEKRSNRQIRMKLYPMNRQSTLEVKVWMGRKEKATYYDGTRTRDSDLAYDY